MRKKRLSLQDKAELAIKEAVRDVIKQHKKDNRLLAIWQDNKVKMVKAK